jgi:hypothetical protein
MSRIRLLCFPVAATSAKTSVSIVWIKPMSAHRQTYAVEQLPVQLPSPPHQRRILRPYLFRSILAVSTVTLAPRAFPIDPVPAIKLTVRVLLIMAESVAKFRPTEITLAQIPIEPS